MSKEKRTITNESGKEITLMIDPENTNQHIWHTVEWTVTKSQWKRIVAESDCTHWTTEEDAVVKFTCHPFAAECEYPGRA